MRMLLLGALMFVLTGCPKDSGPGDDESDDDGGAAVDAAAVDAAVDQACNMTGVWIAEQHTVSLALGAQQRATIFYYYEIEQTDDRFTIVDAMHCGLVVDGTTTVTIGDETLEALARQEMAGPNRQGTYTQNGDQCEFTLDRMYNIRGANKEQYLTDHWNVGDPGKELSTFPELPTEPPGMEDWDGDNMDGITLTSALGQRYVSQRDWNQHAGTTGTFAAEFGGEGVIVVEWDNQEGISEQTDPLLRNTASPSGDGWARYARAPNLEIIPDDDLQSCRNVQQLIQQTWPPKK
jgi:hypothetical protein